MKPFNPVLGETYQAHFPGGTSLFSEQVSHHPPVTQFQLVGPGGLFHYHGHHEYVATFKPNVIVGQQLGPNSMCVAASSRLGGAPHAAWRLQRLPRRNAHHVQHALPLRGRHDLGRPHDDGEHRARP